MKRIEALHVIVSHTRDIPVVATCGATSRELASIDESPNHLYLLDSMGLTSTVGTGLAIAVEGSAVARVAVIDGDGSLLMNLNALATASYLALDALLVICLDNQAYASTAGLPTYTTVLDLGAIAGAAGLNVARANDAEGLATILTHALTTPGPHFLHVPIEPGNAADMPLVLLDPAVLAGRFGNWLRAAMWPKRAD